MSPDPDTNITRPIMRQDWRNVTFLHWRVDPGVVRGLIPPQLEPDVFDGSAWIGLVPFLIENLSTPKARRFPGFRGFPKRMFEPTSWMAQAAAACGFCRSTRRDGRP